MTQQDMKDDQLWEVTHQAIQREYDAILASEGANHVRGVYFVSVDDASKARMHAAAERVKLKGRQAVEVEAMRARASAHVKELFDASPYCAVCSEKIPALEQATVFTPISGKDRLLHDNGDCLQKMIEQSIGRYMGRGRGGVVRSAAR